MIKRPSRSLITRSLTSNLPLCVNTFDYNASSTAPGEPLPSSVGITVNAPAKLNFSSLGTSGFTSSSNSYGVTTVSPRLPFTLTNPVRMQFKGIGVIGTTAESPPRPAVTFSSVQVTRASNSDSTVFDTSAASFTSKALIEKFVTNGYYLRSNSSYLFAVYGKFRTNGYGAVERHLLFVYAPIKLLPQVVSVRCLRFPVYDSPAGADPEFSPSTGGNSYVTDFCMFADEDSVEFVCETSPQVIDVDNIVMEEFNTFQVVGSRLRAYGVAIGVTSLSFTL